MSRDSNQKALEQQGRLIEVTDLRSIIPFDEEMIYKSVRKTNRVVIAHEDSLTMGFGAEIAARTTKRSPSRQPVATVRPAHRSSFRQ